MQALKTPTRLAILAPNADTTSKWRAHSIWVLIANLAQAGGVFLTLLILSRLQGLDVAGQFAYAQAIATPVSQLLGLQLKALILTHSAEELSISSAAAVRCATTGVGILFAFGLTIFVHPLTGILLAAKLVESWAEMFQANFQRKGFPNKAAWNAVLRSCFLIAAILLAPSLETAIGLYFILSLSLLCVSEMDPSGLALNFQLQIIGPMVRRGLVLGVVLFLQAVQVSIPRVVLERESTAQSLGIFATLCVIVQAGNLMVSSYGQSEMPRLGTQSRREIHRFIAKPAAWAIAVLVPLFVAGPWILRTMHLQFADGSAETFYTLCVVQIFIWPATVVGYALTARRHYREQIGIAILLNVVALLGSYLLIPRFGSAGAAAALGLSALAMLLASVFVLRASAGTSSDLTNLSSHLARSGVSG